MIDLAEVERFFYRAMLQGYASSSEKRSAYGMPGHREYLCGDGKLLLLDRYCVNSGSTWSAGTTTIWFEGEPIWVMQYGGFYKEAAIPLLKEALRTGYSDKPSEEFWGCRGPAKFAVGVLTYVNRVDLGDDVYVFADFAGEEQIYDQGEDLLGWHRYQGMSLMRREG